MTDVSDDVQEEERIAAAEHAMIQAGVPTSEPVLVDYFGFEQVERVYLDSVQWVEHRVLNEGQRRKYLNQINRGVRIQKTSGDAMMSLAPGDESHYLLDIALTNWNLTRQGVTVAFNDKSKKEFLEKAPPVIINKILKEVRKHNPWLLQEMSSEDIKKEISDLEEMLKVKLEEEEGKGSSSNK